MKNSTELTDDDEEEVEEVEEVKMAAIKHHEMPANHELEVVHEETEMVEKNSIEEQHEEVTEESNEFQVELIPHTHHGIDASIVTSAASESELDEPNQPQKITFSVMEPIVELPTSRNIRKRSGRHRSGRFLFKADAH